MTYDVIITGAGPAGSTCARACAKAGLRTLILELDVFPRAKPCGGALSERALASLDFALPPDIIERECYGARVHYGTHTVEVRKDRRIAVTVSREKFDHFLAKQAVDAGAVLREGEPVQSVAVAGAARSQPSNDIIEGGRPEGPDLTEAGQPRRVASTLGRMIDRVRTTTTVGDRVEVTTEGGRYEARCIVGADGANSVVGRKIRPLFPRYEISVGLVGTVPCEDREIDARNGDLLDMYFGVAPLGYGWVFPRKGACQVGVMGQASEFEAPRKVLDDFSKLVGLPVPRPQGHTIPWGGFPRPVIGPRMLLVGDAAGFADPFNGEGIASALLSGKLAAQAVVDGIGGKKDTLMWYARECERLIVREMQIAGTMAQMLERYPKLFLAIFFRDRTALGQYLEIAAGRSDYRSFRRWLLPRLPRYVLRMLVGNAFSRK